MTDNTDDDTLHKLAGMSQGPALEPHAYVAGPSMFMGDCGVCGHREASAIHAGFDKPRFEPGKTYRTRGGTARTTARG